LKRRKLASPSGGAGTKEGGEFKEFEEFEEFEEFGSRIPEVGALRHPPGRHTSRAFQDRAQKILRFSRNIHP
jgi:hypothetical protein